MKLARPALAATVALASLASLPLAAQPASRVSKEELATAGRQATLKLIDYGSDYCDIATTVEAWLKALVGRRARTITWTGGDCVLVHNMRPGIDASEWPYCAQAMVTLVHPMNKKGLSIIEIYLEKPQHGRPGQAYAFRGTTQTRDGGPEYIRFRKDFEGLWDERFPPETDVARCKDD